MILYKTSSIKTLIFYTVFLSFWNFNAFSQCNGAVDSCNKKYNEVAYLTTHNAFNSGQDGFAFPNQNNNIATQLNDGVRGLMIDVYDSNGTPVVYHGSSIFGSEPLSRYLNDIKSFLDNNPNEIITIIFQNDPGVSANTIENDFNQAGLSNYLHVQNKFSPWPTLQTMINANKRLVVFNEVNNATPGQDWYHHIWDFAVEINYGSINCDYGRGNPSNDLFVFNHFITSGLGTGSTGDAQTVNSNPYFIDHVTQCQQAKNKLPNFITVDFYDLGNSLDVVNQLNASNPGSGGNDGGSGNPPGNGSDNTDPKILQLETGGQIIIKANASLNLKGLKLTPDTDHTLVADNTATRSLEALGDAPNESMARVFNFASSTNDFTGKIVYYYDTIDMGTITHNDAVLQVKNDADAWSNYLDEDATDHQITYTFNSPVKLKSVTASASSTTLSINPMVEEMNIAIFPNPVRSELNIRYQGDLDIELFDFLGRTIIRTKSKIIDMGTMPVGVYIIQTTNKSTNQKNSYKIIKK
ncbi:putative secreted protein (Por secretion system target) [Flavobacteriaceae bacterium MAR_2010_72]|nr:putative secreted protein (Por secretion system target) [Flavobacteriaceae bacterium MAR_2010_72]